ncbi:SDR family NAD(P)-dependent oxidoreductase [Alkalihalobacillus sp. BA299]|uniref:SDR family NAD(P)-dependent oxidoreductase n=1 Tax=Alkalihalobacillus sp. BA299 TaxID=2815938 RepID=UPI001ADB0CB1|nr:3-oxoacyl-ACP reductase family protein [Alkalihalobacillus sp. BA299]
MYSFDQKVVWVTGSSTGIGRAIALAFAEHGADVVVHGNSNLSKAEETLEMVRSKGVKAILVSGDVTDRGQVNQMASEIEKEFGRLDILINNAGTMVTRTKIEDLDVDTWNDIMNINLNSVFHVTQAALPLLKQQKEGQIINMTSLAARNGGGPGAVAYATAKGAVSTFTRGLAKELVGYNIRVNGIGPGIITTPFHDRYSTAEMRKGMANQVPLGREGTAEEVAGAALYLASPYASYITGEIIEVNGGLLMD